MYFIQKRLQVYPRATHTISAFWKISHIIDFFLIAASGLVSGALLVDIQRQFGNYCPLFAELKISCNATTNRTSNFNILPRTKLNKSTTYVDYDRSIYPYQRLCSLFISLEMVVSMGAIIFAGFFTIVSKGGEGYSYDHLRPWALVFPAVIFTIVSNIIQVIMVTATSRGLTYVYNEMKGFEPRCVDKDKVFNHEFVVLYKLIEFFSNLEMLFLLLQAALFALRVLLSIDFEVQIVYVYCLEDTGDEFEEQYTRKITPESSGQALNLFGSSNSTAVSFGNVEYNFIKKQNKSKKLSELDIKSNEITLSLFNEIEREALLSSSTENSQENTLEGYENISSEMPKKENKRSSLRQEKQLKSNDSITVDTQKSSPTSSVFLMSWKPHEDTYYNKMKNDIEESEEIKRKMNLLRQRLKPEAKLRTSRSSFKEHEDSLFSLAGPSKPKEESESEMNLTFYHQLEEEKQFRVSSENASTERFIDAIMLLPPPLSQTDFRDSQKEEEKKEKIELFPDVSHQENRHHHHHHHRKRKDKTKHLEADESTSSKKTH